MPYLIHAIVSSILRLSKVDDVKEMQELLLTIKDHFTK